MRAVYRGKSNRGFPACSTGLPILIYAHQKKKSVLNVAGEEVSQHHCNDGSVLLYNGWTHDCTGTTCDPPDTAGYTVSVSVLEIYK